MTLLGIAQIVIFFAIVLAITKPVGVFMYRVFEGERTFLHPILRPLERLIYWLGGVREDVEQSWVRYSASMISLSIFSFLFVYVLQRLQGLPAAESDALLDAAGARKRHADDAGPGVQHGRQLHDEHELAVVFAGHDDELPGADGGARGPELCFRRRRNCGCGRADPRICAPHREDDRKFLGRCDALHALHPASDFHSGDAVLCLAGIHSELQGACDGNDAGRRDPDD